MASRNLSKKFFELRASYKPVSLSIGSDNQRRGLLGATEDDEYETKGNIHHSLPPIWVDHLDTIDQNMEDIRKKTYKLQSLHSQRLNISFDDEKSAKQDQEIEEVTRAITAIFRTCKREMSNIATKGNDNHLPKQERTVRYNVMRSRATQLQELTVSFRQAQRNYLEKLENQNTTSSRYFEDAKIPQLDQGFTDQQVQRMVEAQRDQQERGAQIVQIAKSVNELAQLFRELSILVVEQGTILDRIDYNVEQSLANVRAGHEELKLAETHQKRSRTTLCILVLIIMVVVFGVILLLKQVIRV